MESGSTDSSDKGGVVASSEASLPTAADILPTVADISVEEPAAANAEATGSGLGDHRDGEFSSQNFRISIRNLFKFPGYRNFTSWLTGKCGFEPHRVYTRGIARNNVIYVAFKSDEDREIALKRLEDCFYKGERLNCRKESAQRDPYAESRTEVGKRGRGKQGGGQSKRPKHLDPALEGLSPEERISKSIEPYRGIPYEEQLKRKQDWVSMELKTITAQLFKNTLVPPWLPPQKAANGGRVCELLDIMDSPNKEAYRIKNEFSIGPGPESDSPEVTVGFRLGAYKEGMLTIVSPEQCSIVPQTAKNVAKAFQDYLRQSEMLYFDEPTHLGYWQTLTVRTPDAGGCMAVIQLHPQGLTQPEVDNEMKLLTAFFQEGAGKECGITSMYLTFDLARYRTQLNASYHVFGDTHIHEKLLGLTYRISPGAFFQVNTLATERLYSTICDWCDVTENSVVLDICCGTGTIALALAKRVKKVIGIEMCEEAVEDARHNAELNGITNVEFICGRAEHVLKNVMRGMHRSTELIAVVDPPRAGLHPDVVQAIRKCSMLKRLVFVACNLKQSKENVLYLSKHPSNSVPANGFKPIRAVPIDMFPHTPHCEVAMLLERLPPPKLSDFETPQSKQPASK